MDVARWTVVRRVFEEALDQPEETRDRFVREATRGDETLRAEVERLLALHTAEEQGASPTPPAADELLAALARGAPLQPGATLGTWRLLRRLGAGGMGEVWEAEQARPQRRAAVKVMRAGRAGARALQRFRDEIDALARLEHPGIARILEAGEREDGSLWYAMELVPGARPLTEWTRDRELSWGQAVALLRRVCEAVEHGHRNGVIHRDLKAGNILVDAGGRPRVIDFGVARLTGEGLATQTQAGELVGTLATMAPEQLEGRADVRSDVYALGVLLYELLAGRPPYEVEGLGLAEATRRVREVRPPPPSAARPGIPHELDWIVGQALEKDPERRYAGAGALGEDLRRLLEHEPVAAGAPGRMYRARKFVRRHRVGVAFAVVVLVLLVGGIAGTTSGLLQAIEARNDAETRQREAEAARAQEAVARQQAQDSADESEAVTRFLVDVFGSADPDKGGTDMKVADALDDAESRIAGFLQEHPRAEVRLRAALGLLDFDLGRYEAAEVQYVRALEVDAQIGGMTPELVAQRSDIAGNLGVARVDLGKFAEAEVDLQGTLEQRRERDGPDSPRLADVLNALAQLRHKQGRLADSEAFYRQALDIAQAARDRDDPQCERAVDVARIQGNLGSLLFDQMRVEEAEPLLLYSLDTFRVLRGSDNPLVIGTLNNLAGLRMRQRRYDESAALMEEAYTLRARHLPPDHPELLATRGNLATLRFLQGRPGEAAEMLEDVLARRLLKEPPCEPDLLTMLANLGVILRARGDGDEGVRGVAQRLQAAGVGESAISVQSAVPLEAFAHYLESCQMLPEAVALLDEAIAARTRLQPREDPYTLDARIFRARLLVGLERVDEALAELSDVRSLMAALPADDVHRAPLDHALALAWLVAGNPALAEPVLLEELNLLEAGGRPTDVRAALDALASVCDATGRPDEADQWRERLAALANGEAPR